MLYTIHINISLFQMYNIHKATANYRIQFKREQLKINNFHSFHLVAYTSEHTNYKYN